MVRYLSERNELNTTCRYDKERNILTIIENIYTIFRRGSIEDTNRTLPPFSFLSISLRL